MPLIMKGYEQILTVDVFEFGKGGTPKQKCERIYIEYSPGCTQFSDVKPYKIVWPNSLSLINSKTHMVTPNAI